MNKGKKAVFLSEDGIRAEFSPLFEKKVRVHLYDVTDSTNQRAKELAEVMTPEDKEYVHLFVAAEQTNGRGRIGRSFDSARGSGVYMSILTFPDISAEDGALVTPYAAVALCRTLKRLTPLEPKIKWVNDIYSGSKKLAGILTEGSCDIESDRLLYCITGFGINLYTRDFGTLREIATDIESECGIRLDPAVLVAGLTEEFVSSLDSVGASSYIEEYRAHSMLIGKKVTVLRGDEGYEATVKGITDRCELLVDKDGEKRVLFTGEVSLKL